MMKWDTVRRGPNSALRLFFTVYQDPSIGDKPTLEVEFQLNGKTLSKAPIPLPAADAQGRIPYLMTIPADAIPPGTYQVQATAKQGDTSSVIATTVKVEGN